MSPQSLRETAPVFNTESEPEKEFCFAFSFRMAVVEKIACNLFTGNM